MRITKKKLAAVAVGTAVAVTGATVAFAYFTTTGSGEGSATTGTDTPWNVVAMNAATKTLTPGGPTQTVPFSVKNESSGFQRLNSVTVAVAGPAGAAWTSGTCNKDDFSVTITGFTATTLAPNDTATGNAVIQMLNLDENQNDCRNLTVPLYFSAI